jgi:hypothetical protein
MTKEDTLLQGNARMCALHEAARLAETYDLNGIFSGGLPKGWEGCRRKIAEAIRALAVNDEEPNATSASANSWHTACVNVLWTKAETYKLFDEVKEFAEAIERGEVYPSRDNGPSAVPQSKTNFMGLVSAYGNNPTQQGFDTIYARYLADCDLAARSKPAAQSTSLSDAQLNAAMDEYDRKISYYRSHGGVTKNERKIIAATVHAALSADPSPETNVKSSKADRGGSDQPLGSNLTEPRRQQQASAIVPQELQKNWREV